MFFLHNTSDNHHKFQRYSGFIIVAGVGSFALAKYAVLQQRTEQMKFRQRVEKEAREEALAKLEATKTN